MLSNAGGGAPGCNSQQSIFHAAFYPQEIEGRPSFALFEVDGKKMKITSYLGEGDDIEKDIIVKHMFPLNIKLPRYRESYIVTIADKICSSYEVIYGVPCFAM